MNDIQKLAVLINEADNCLTAVREIPVGKYFLTMKDGTREFSVPSTIPAGFKFAFTALPKGTFVFKYGYKIGAVTHDVAPGSLIHVHNLASLVGMNPQKRTTV